MSAAQMRIKYENQLEIFIAQRSCPVKQFLQDKKGLEVSAA
jgi:hypothetical protein